MLKNNALYLLAFAFVPVFTSQIPISFPYNDKQVRAAIVCGHTSESILEWQSQEHIRKCWVELIKATKVSLKNDWEVRLKFEGFRSSINIVEELEVSQDETKTLKDVKILAHINRLDRATLLWAENSVDLKTLVLEVTGGLQNHIEVPVKDFVSLLQQARQTKK